MTTLADFLAHEVTLLRNFVTTLSDEQDALRTGAVEHLPSLTEQKTALLPQLAAASQAREDYLQALGLASEQGGLQHWLAQHPEDEASVRHWQTLLALAEQARDLNALNGKLIDIRMQANTRALETLTQHHPQAGLYSAKGETAGFSGYRLIDSA